MAVYRAWQEDDPVSSLMRLGDDAVQPGIDEIKDWYSSEIEQVMTAFMEVNKSFFGIARLLKMDGLMETVIRDLTTSLPAVFADSFSAAMQTPGITAGQPS